MLNTIGFLTIPILILLSIGYVAWFTWKPKLTNPPKDNTQLSSFDNYLSERMNHRFVLEPVLKNEDGIHFEIHSMTSGDRYYQFFTVKDNTITPDQ